MANASYNTYQSPIDRAQTIRGNRLANDTRQIQSNTADLNNQKESRAVEQYDRALKTTTLARDSYELLTAAPEMREQLIRSYAEKDQTGFWKGTVNQSSENIQHMLENNVTRGQQLGAFGEAPKDTRSPELKLYQEGLNDPEFAKTQTNPPEIYTDADGFKRDSLTNKRVNPNLKVAPEIYTDADGFKRDSLTNKRVNPNLKVAPEDTRSPQRKLYDEMIADPAFAESQETKSDDVTTKQAEIEAYEKLGFSNERAVKLAYNQYSIVTDPVSGMSSLVDKTTGESINLDNLTLKAMVSRQPEGDTITDGPSLNLFNNVNSQMTGAITELRQIAQDTIGQVFDAEFLPEPVRNIRQKLKMQQQNLVRSLMTGDRFTATEMSAILKEVEIEPKTWLSGSSLKSKLKAIDETLRNRLINERDIIHNPSSSAKSIAKSLETSTAINNFLRNLAVPQTETTTQPQANELVPEGINPEDWDYVSPENKKAILESRKKSK